MDEIIRNTSSRLIIGTFSSQLERIMRIHVTEEARHLSFARQYLRTNVPTLSRRRRRAISIQAPFILAEMASVMMRPPRSLVRSPTVTCAKQTSTW